MKELKFIKSIMIKAGKLINYNDFDIQDKSINDIVTNKDLAVENYLINKISKKFPNDKFITEETNPNSKLGQGRFWIIDPIDGTTNLANKIGMYAIQLALIENEKTVLGAIYSPITNEFLHATEGNGAFLNNQPISTTKINKLNQAVCTLPDFKSKRQNLMYLFERVYDKVARIQIHSTAAIDFSLVAKGSTAFHIIGKKHIWDYLPGHFIAEQAGAVFKEIPLAIDNNVTLLIVASNENILNELLPLIIK